MDEARASSAVLLRPAEPGDLDRLWQWRNEPTTRQASLDTEAVALDVHTRWFAQQLASDDVALFIIEALPHRTPCGQLRLNQLAAGDALVSIGIASECRGRGLATAALREVVRPEHRPAWAHRLVAMIRAANEASRRAFERAGFTGPHSHVPESLGAVPAGVGIWLHEGAGQ